MTLFGHHGRLPFTAITQPWLRQAAKIWAAADLPRRRGRAGGDKTRHHVSSLAPLSQSLRQRPDRGEDPAARGRNDIEPFLARLSWLHSAGQVSELTRVLACREVRKLLITARQLGATRPGGPAEGLSDQFALHRDEMPDEPEHGEPGRDLPAEIMRQICGRLPDLAAPHIRTAAGILIDTGRRPEDVVALPLDCLELPLTVRRCWSMTTTRRTVSGGGCPSLPPPQRRSAPSSSGSAASSRTPRSAS